MTSALVEVIKYAKKYRKEHPSSEWKNAVKHGGAEYRKKHGTKSADKKPKKAKKTKKKSKKTKKSKKD
jgi:hypothetical protein